MLLTFGLLQGMLHSCFSCAEMSVCFRTKLYWNILLQRIQWMLGVMLIECVWLRIFLWWSLAHRVISDRCVYCLVV